MSENMDIYQNRPEPFVPDDGEGDGRVPMKKDELEIAKNIGEQISGKFYCPECTLLPDHLQKMYVCGDFENELYCPHCEMTVTLVVKR